MKIKNLKRKVMVPISASILAAGAFGCGAGAGLSQGKFKDKNLGFIKGSISKVGKSRITKPKTKKINSQRILNSEDIKDGFLVPKERARAHLVSEINKKARNNVPWAKRIFEAQKGRIAELNKNKVKVTDLSSATHFKYDPKTKEFTAYFNEGVTDPNKKGLKDYMLDADDKVIGKFNASALDLEGKLTKTVSGSPDPSKLNSGQLSRLAQLYKQSKSADEKSEIQNLVFGYLKANPNLVWNVGIGLFAPDGEKANAGTTQYDNRSFEELKATWENIRDYVSPSTIVEAAGKIQANFTDTGGSSSTFEDIRSYLKAKKGKTVENAVYGLLGGENRTIEGGEYKIGQFFDGNLGNYEVSHVSLQVHRNGKKAKKTSHAYVKK